MQKGAELVFALGTLEFMEQADDLLGSGDDTEPALLKGNPGVREVGVCALAEDGQTPEGCEG